MIATVYYPEHKKSGGKAAITWVLVMDSRRAQIFTKDLDAMAPILAPVLHAPLIATPVEREVGRHALPRVHESVGNARQALSMLRGEVQILPFRGIVRKISGADKHARRVIRAYEAGKLRRAFLKGLALAYKCE